MSYSGGNLLEAVQKTTLSFLCVTILASCIQTIKIKDRDRIEWGIQKLYKSLKNAGYTDYPESDFRIEVRVDPFSDIINPNSACTEGFGIDINNKHIRIDGYDAAGCRGQSKILSAGCYI